jgi:xylulokinase
MSANQPVSIGIDLGTSGVKVIALTPDGSSVASAHATYPLLTPHPGWTEQRPQDWLEGTVRALRELTAQLEGHYQPVAVGVAGQMHGAVFLDADNNVIRPAPLWNDQRTAEACLEIERAIPAPELIARTGNAAVTGFQLPKLLWLRGAEPQAFGRVRHLLFPKDYLNLCMTGVIASEPSDASGSGALEIASQTWDEGIIGALQLNRAAFPELHPSSGVIGTVTTQFSSQSGLPAGIPVVAGAGDNAGAAIGLGISSAHPGVGSVSLGTSGVIIVPLETARPEPEGRVHLFCHADGGYFLLGVTLSAAGSLQWLRDKLAPDVPFDTLMLEAAGVPSGCEGVSFMPYLSGERSPLLDSEIRGAWLGLSLAHGRGHLTRAVLEGVAFSLRDTLEVMKPLASLETALAVGGGAKSDVWLGIVANALGVNFAKPALEEGPARGAAVLALVGAGVYANAAAAISATAPQSEMVTLSTDAGLEAAYWRYGAGLRAAQTFRDG